MRGYDSWALLLGLAAGLACGFLNTSASSGSAVSLPILMIIGLDPVTANATNRFPVLIGALSATTSFHWHRALPWRIAAKVSLPVSIGGIIGAGLAEILPGRSLALIITAAVLLALVLLFTKLKQVIESAGAREIRLGLKEFLLFLGIGGWLGFIVVDGATYMLLALTIAVGLSLAPANAVKSAVIVPVTLIAMAIFAYKGHIDWTLGAVAGLGSVAGGYLGARLAISPAAKRWVFWLLVIVLGGELIHLFTHYVFGTF